jgi:hypothetical protein
MLLEKRSDLGRELIRCRRGWSGSERNRWQESNRRKNGKGQESKTIHGRRAGR